MVKGLIDGGKAKRDFNNTMKQRKAFVTPEETYKILQATQANAQSGYDAETMDYLTTQNDRAFTSSLDVLQRLGGDPNAAAGIFDQQMQNIFKVGAQNHAIRLENFSKFIGALGTLSDSKAAEWASQQDIVKDKLQAANANRAAAAANVNNGLNTIIGGFSAKLTGDLFKKKQDATTAESSDTTPTGRTSSSGYSGLVM